VASYETVGRISSDAPTPMENLLKPGSVGIAEERNELGEER
jgi:hypothetical protein